jgi:hypothetical protein
VNKKESVPFYFGGLFFYKNYDNIKKEKRGKKEKRKK